MHGPGSYTEVTRLTDTAASIQAGSLFAPMPITVITEGDVSPEGAAGDYLVWEQVLSEAARRKLDVVFVTGDVKKDWWRYEGSFPRGPRVELVRELRHRCETMLYMMRPDMLLAYADVLSVTVEKRSVQDVGRTTRTETPPTSEAGNETGWTARELKSLLLRLVTIAPVQEATIRLAGQQGGYVSREDVYRLGEYEPDRQLKGFTRPVNRLVQDLRDSGELPDDAADALSPVYETVSYGFGRVDGFRIPEEIVGCSKSNWPAPRAIGHIGVPEGQSPVWPGGYIRNASAEALYAGFRSSRFRTLMRRSTRPWLGRRSSSGCRVTMAVGNSPLAGFAAVHLGGPQRVRARLTVNRDRGVLQARRVGHVARYVAGLQVEGV